MATRRKVTESNREVQELPVISPPESLSEIDDLAAFLEELDGGETATVSVYRDVKGRATGKYLFRCTPTEFSLSEVMDKLRDEYDGGEFRIVVFANGVRLKHQLVEVEAPKKSPHDFGVRPGLSHQQLPQTNPSDSILQMIEAMRSQTESMREMIFQQQQNMSNTLIEVLRSNNGNSQSSSLSDLVSVFTVAQAALGGKSNGDSSEKLIDMFFKGMEMGRGEGGGDESILQTAIKAFGPALSDLTKIASDQAKGGAQQFRPASQLYRPTPTAAAPQVIEGVVDEPQPLQQQQDVAEQLRPYVQMLMQAAAKDTDPEVYANLLADQVPAYLLQEWLTEEANYLMLLGYFPQEAQQFKEWFDTLREIVLGFIGDELGGQADGAGEYTQDVPRGTGPAVPADGDNPE